MAPRRRGSRARSSAARLADRVPERVRAGRGSRANPGHARGPVDRVAAAAGQREPDRDCQRCGRRRAGAERRGTVGPHHAERDQCAGGDDRGQEDRVEQDEEREQRARGPARAQARPAQRPQRERGAAGAGRRQQPCRGGSGERDLGALTCPDARARPSGDEREQEDVGEDREALERDRDHRPGGTDRERAPQHVGERVHAAACEQDHGHGHGADGGGRPRPPRERAHVKRGERQL